MVTKKEGRKEERKKDRRKKDKEQRKKKRNVIKYHNGEKEKRK